MTASILVFRVGDREFGIPACHVAGVQELRALVGVPVARPGVAGIAVLGEEVLVVLDLSRILGFTSGEWVYLMVLELDGRRMGIPIGHVDGIRQFAPGEVRLPVAGERQSSGAFVRLIAGMEDDSVAVLSTQRLMDYLWNPSEGVLSA